MGGTEGWWVFGCRKDEGREGLAGAEGALLPSTDRTGRCPCGEAALTALVEEVAAFRVGRAHFLYPFQKGLLVTVRAVRGLLADLQAKFGNCTYLLTRHLTQDRLESFFGLVRGRGGANQNLRLLTLLQLTRHGVSPKCAGAGEEPDAAPDVPQPETDEEPPPQQLLELEVCPAPTEEIPEDTEHMVPEEDEPPVDAEEEAERELLVSMLAEAETVHRTSDVCRGRPRRGVVD